MISFRLVTILLAAASVNAAGFSQDYNALILKTIEKEMPKGGEYARYRKDWPAGTEFDGLYQAVSDLKLAINNTKKFGVVVHPKEAKNYSFCSSATYLVFAKAIEKLKSELKLAEKGDEDLHIWLDLMWEIGRIGDEKDVIGGKLDGVGIFGHWNADGPGTAMLFKTLDLGTNFSDYAKAKPGDFMKIFWNENIGKGESGHLVVFLGEADGGNSVRVWSSQTKNDDGTSGYGVMTVEKSRIKRVVFSRLERPENLANWLKLPESQRSSAYLIRIRKTGSSGEEMKKMVGIVD